MFSVSPDDIEDCKQIRMDLHKVLQDWREKDIEDLYIVENGLFFFLEGLFSVIEEEAAIEILFLLTDIAFESVKKKEKGKNK